MRTRHRVFSFFIVFALATPGVASANSPALIRQALEEAAKSSREVGGLSRSVETSRVAAGSRVVEETLSEMSRAAKAAACESTAAGTLSRLGISLGEIQARAVAVAAENLPAELGEVVGESGVRSLSREEALALVGKGFTPRPTLLTPEFIRQLESEVIRLVDEGVIPPSPERMVRYPNGQEYPSEWILSMGLLRGRGPEWLAENAPTIAVLYEDLQKVAASYNASREMMVATGLGTIEELPEIAPESIYLNVNYTIGAPESVGKDSYLGWSGLQPHQDHLRFTNAAMQRERGMLGHDYASSRAGITITGYARPQHAGQQPPGGGWLPMFLRQPVVRTPTDRRGVISILPAEDNVGGIFIPQTVHAVAEMPPGSQRISFQAFFSEKRAWEEDLLPRFEAGEPYGGPDVSGPN